MERSKRSTSNKIGNAIMIAAATASLGGCGNKELDEAKQNTQIPNGIERKLSKKEADNEIALMARGIEELVQQTTPQKLYPSPRAVPSKPKPSLGSDEKTTQRFELLNHEKRIKVLELDKAQENSKTIDNKQRKDENDAVKRLDALHKEIDDLVK